MNPFCFKINNPYLYVLTFLFISTLAHSQSWLTDFENAKKNAATENKNIILVFSGSDWCAPCIKLEKSIWQSEAFKTEAQTNWILVKADFPKKKAHSLSEAQQLQNDKLAELYNREGNFPLVVILNKDGKILGKTGYKNVSPNDYINLIHSIENKI